MSKWPLVSLRDAGVSLIDCDHKTPKAQEIGFPYIGIPQLKNGRVVLDGARLISLEDFHQWRRKAKPLPHDVILSRRCNPGEIAYVPEKLEIALGQNLVLLRADGVKVFPPFLRWIAQGPDWWVQVNSFINVGAVFDSLKCADIPKFQIRLPSISDQRRITKILEDLDRKVELNQNTNQTLEKIAQAIFKSWFVDFEPTRAKIAASDRWLALHEVIETSSPTCYSAEFDSANQPTQTLEGAMTQAAMAAISGKTPEELEKLCPEQQQNLRNIAALFPDTLVDSDLGEIPQGWKLVPFGNLLSKTIGGDWGSESPDAKHTERVKILRGTDLPNVYAGDDSRVPVRYVESKKLANRELESGDIVIEVSGGSPTQPTGRSLYLTEEIIERLDARLEPASFCRLFRPSDVKTGLILGLHLQKIYNDGKTWLYQNTSTGISNFQTKEFLEKELVVLPDFAVSEKFYEMVNPYLRKMSSRENALLANLRDTLLPKLLSGELSLASSPQKTEIPC